MNFLPRPRGFAVPKMAAAIYWGAVAACLAVLLALGRELPAILLLGVGLCVFVLADVLLSIKKAPPVRRGRKIYTVFTCCLTGAALVFCCYEAVKLLFI